ncbi:MAG TPA: beta-propeller fold lactonase family protein [Verrucomicrobiae bacterium]|nr:beta-propeller fold lactonase family protein [Verrucomicrobiae bacterium]
MFRFLIALLFLVLGAIGGRAADLPGRRADGSVLLPNQWSLRPIGAQIPVGDFPVNIALHPGGKFAAVLHCGYGQHEIVVLDLTTRAIASRTKLAEAFYGLTFSKDGARLFCSGSAGETIHAFRFDAGQLVDSTAFALRDPMRRGIPAGLAVSADARTLYAANLWGHSVSRVRLAADGTAQADELPLLDHAAPEAAKPTSTTDDPSITKRANQLLETNDPAAPFPYACVLDERRARLYVSLWAQSEVAVIDTRTFTLVGRWKTEAHPNEMLLGKDGRRLYVANANHNTVSVLDVSADGRPIETLLAELQPDSPPGNTPNSLALSSDGTRLFVANANINTVAVFDIATPGKSRSAGFIPVGWYPTSVRVSLDGKTLYIANGKGEISKANPLGPQPGRKGTPGVNQYIGGLMNGTVSIIPLPGGGKLDAQLAAWTAQAYQCVPEAGRRHAEAPPDGNPIPRKVGDPSPIRYVLYVIKENRTYDQVLGDMAGGNGDPSLCLFPESVTPNHHALAREFVLLDNFYVESEVSADGHEWTMGAYATDFVEKSWPLSYGHGKSKKFPFPAEGHFAIATPAGGYLWDRAKQAGVTYRSYGEWITNGKTPGDPGTATVEALVGHFDPLYRGFDMGYPDQKRADRFLSELARFEGEGEMPRLQIVRLPNDHTSGTSPGKPTPTAQVADNDLALGRIVEGLSKSKFWPQMAIFVVEDDAQNGPDHVDAHRTIAYAISPYIRRGSVDSTMYSTTSMLRTMELILGLAPMSQFDAAAMPMFASFQAKSDITPYTARPVTVNLEELNAKTAWGGKASQQMDFTKEDAADDILLNEMVWKSVRGAASPMPAPRRAAFVFTQKKDDDD